MSCALHLKEGQQEETIGVSVQLNGELKKFSCSNDCNDVCSEILSGGMVGVQDECRKPSCDVESSDLLNDVVQRAAM